MWIKKLLNIAAAGAITVGVASSIIFTSTSCSKDEEEFISLVSTEKAILNKATLTFKLEKDNPENIQLAWIQKSEDAKKIKITQNHEIPVDPATGTFSLDLEVLLRPKDWTQIDFGIAIQYEIGGQTFVRTCSKLTLDNGTTQTESIESIYGRTKMVTSISDDAVFSFCFDNSLPTTELPEKINSVTFYELPKKFENAIELTKTSDIDVDLSTRHFDLSAKFKQKIEEAVSFSLLLTYDINGNNYCYYTDTLSLILYESDDTNNIYLTMTSADESGLISYGASGSNGSNSVPEKNLFYRINDDTCWTYLSLYEQIYLPPNSKIDFRGINDEWSSAEIKYRFNIDLPASLSGSPEALLHGGAVSNTMSGDYCFAHLFEGCAKVVSVVPDFLPMHTLFPHCYDSIFLGCKKLSCDGDFLLPAKQLEDSCYSKMFAGSNIDNVKYYANILPAKPYCDCWLMGCQNPGTVLLPFDIDVEKIERDDYNIPEEWTIQTFKEPLTIIAKEDCHIKLYGYKEDDTIDPEYTEAKNKQILYSCNYPNETFKPVPALFSEEIFLHKGEYAYFQGKNENGWYNQDTDDHHIGFYFESACDINGSIMSLVDPTLTTTIIPSTADKWCGFPNLFAGSSVETIGKYVLDVTENLPIGCFKHMFYDCDNLINTGFIGNLLKSVHLQDNCCEGMFDSCYHLETIDADEETGLVPNNFAVSCFREMFANCVNLLKAPTVSDNNSELQMYCFMNMFTGCSYLRFSKPINSKSSAGYCCYEMFANCISLEECPALNITTTSRSDEYCFYRMYYGCTSIQEIPEMRLNLFPPHACLFMFQLCTSLNPPQNSSVYIKIKKDSLYPYCFEQMFLGCKQLKYIHVDLDGWGKEFENLPYSQIGSYFNSWLPNDLLFGRCIYLTNYGDFDFGHIPSSLSAFKPSNWSLQPSE